MRANKKIREKEIVSFFNEYFFGKFQTTTSYTKLEKADILEMAVKHLRQVQRRQFTGNEGSLSTPLNLPQ